MAKIFYGVVTSKPLDSEDCYCISYYLDDDENPNRLVPKYYFNEILEKNDIVKVTNWKRKNVISFRYEKATDEEVFQLYVDILEVFAHNGQLDADLLPNFEIYEDYLNKPKE